MIVVANGLDYEEYLYINPDDPYAPWLIRDDAPQWAKDAYEEELRIYEDAYKDGYF